MLRFQRKLLFLEKTDLFVNFERSIWPNPYSSEVTHQILTFPRHICRLDKKYKWFRRSALLVQMYPVNEYLHHSFQRGTLRTIWEWELTVSSLPESCYPASERERFATVAFPPEQSRNNQKLTPPPLPSYPPASARSPLQFTEPPCSW